MRQMTVHVAATASKAITVELTDDEDFEDAIEKAVNESYVSLCHQCAHEVEVSDDWEATHVFAEDGTLLYEEPR